MTHHPSYRNTPFGQHYARCSCGWISDAQTTRTDATEAFMAHHAQAITDADLARERAALLAAAVDAAGRNSRKTARHLDIAEQAGIPRAQLAHATGLTEDEIEQIVRPRREWGNAGTERRLRNRIGPEDETIWD